MFGAEHPLADVQRAPEERLGRAQVAAALVVAAQHGKGPRHVGVVGAAAPRSWMAIARRSSGSASSTLALHEGHARQVGQRPRGLGMVGAELPLADLDQLLASGRSVCAA